MAQRPPYDYSRIERQYDTGAGVDISRANPFLQAGVTADISRANPSFQAGVTAGGGRLMSLGSIVIVLGVVAISVYFAWVEFKAPSTVSTSSAETNLIAPVRKNSTQNKHPLRKSVVSPTSLTSVTAAVSAGSPEGSTALFQIDVLSSSGHAQLWLRNAGYHVDLASGKVWAQAVQPVLLR